jgi:hypothetical protein
MKKLIILILALSAIQMSTIAQKVELTAFGGYVFPGTWYGSNTSVYLKGGGQYGGQFSFAISRVVDIDLIYNRSDINIEATTYGYNYLETPISINYMQVGFTKNFRVNPTVSPYLGMNIGTVLFYPKEGQYNDTWFFSAGIIGGAKIYFSERIGLKLQAQMYLPVQGAGFTMYFGSGGGGTGVTMYSTLVQFGFTGGLVFRLGRIL